MIDNGLINNSAIVTMAVPVLFFATFYAIAMFENLKGRTADAKDARIKQLEEELDRRIKEAKMFESTLIRKHHRIESLLQRIADNKVVIAGQARRIAVLTATAQMESGMREQSDAVANALGRIVTHDPDAAYFVRAASAQAGVPID